MITKICYVLTSNGTDLYAKMTLVSASLSRRLYPAAEIVVLVDEVTNASLINRDSPILDLATRIVCIETDIEKAAPRSRFVKTSMRRVLDGDFVYLDADVLPIRHFDGISKIGIPMSAAPDLAESFDEPHFPKFAIERLNACGWNAPLPFYFNSGVIFMADTPIVQEFGEVWHKRWKIMWNKTGDHRDQPAFNSAIESSGVQVHSLHGCYNAATYISPWKARKAKILHYWMNAANGQVPKHTLLCHLLDSLEKTGQIDWDAVCRARKRPLSFNTWRQILISSLGPPGRPPRKWLIDWTLRRKYV